MTEIILRELNSSDIDWMTLAGRKVEVAAGDRFLKADQDSDCFYLVLEGKFELILSGSDRYLNSIATYTSGDVIGAFFLLNSRPPVAVQALEKSLVLAIEYRQLVGKLEHDPGFSARFYRAIAMLLSRKQGQIVSRLPELVMTQSDVAMTKAILSVFSGLNDSDMCWMTSAGRVKQLKANQIYLREGQPLESLDIVLEGSLLLFVHEGQNALSLAFSVPHSSQPRNIAQMLPGDILGVSAFLDMTPNLRHIRTAQETRLLSIPIAILMLKLQADIGFAARFYQALASLTAERLFQSINRLGGSIQNYEPGCSLCDQSQYEGELDIQALQKLSVARLKFNWMLQQLGVKDRT